MIDNIVFAFKTLLKHFISNLTNYFFLTGLFLILRYLFVNLGVEIFLLVLGILLVLYAFILEINKKPKKY